MKKLLIITFSLLCLNAVGQKANSTDSLKDTIVVLSYAQAIQIFNDIQTQWIGKADVKREEWSYDLQMLQASLITRTIPKNEKPKK